MNHAHKPALEAGFAYSFGGPNSHNIGWILKESVLRAMYEIREQSQTFQQQSKLGLDGQMDDLVTTADKKAQEIYVQCFQEQLPLLGIVAEEDALKVECKLPNAKV